MATMNQAPQQGAQQGIEQLVVQLVQAAVLGDQKATLQIEQIMQAAQLGNQEAIQIALIIQKVIQAMQAKQGVKAQLGAKLDYINKLKGNCPNDLETYYFKEGGLVKRGCRPCMEKAKEGKKLDKKMNEVLKFKAQKGADSKEFINPNDTVNTKFGPRDLNGNTKFPKYDASKENYDTATRIRVHEKDGASENEGRYWSAGKKEALKSKTEKTEKKKCGGHAKKAKKHFFGGDFSINDAKNPMRMSDGTQMVGVIHRQRFKNATNRGASQTLYDSTGKPIIQKDKTSNGGEREIYYNTVRTPIKRKGLFSPGHVWTNDTVYISGTPEMFKNAPNMSTPEIKEKAYRFALGMD